MRQVNNGRLEILNENTEEIFILEESLEKDNCFVKIKGELRNEYAFELEDEMMALLLTCKKVELDLSGVTYLASKAMQILLSLKRMSEKDTDSELFISGISEAARSTFLETGCYSTLMKKSNEL